MHPSVSMIVVGAAAVLLGGLLVAKTRAGRILGALLFVGGAALLVHRFTWRGPIRYTLFVVGPPGTSFAANGTEAVVSPVGWTKLELRSLDSDPITVRGGKTSCTARPGTSLVLLDGGHPVLATRHDYNFISNGPSEQTIATAGCYPQAYRVLSFDEAVPETIMIHGAYTESLIKLSFAP
jgi:hypothetical protein